MKLGAKTAAILLLFVILVLVNFLASQFSARADLTQDNIYTLSEGSDSLLSKIEEPVTLRFYFSRSLENLPIRFKNYATRVEEMLNQYVSASDGNISLEVIDPQPDTDEETEARRAGILPQQLPTGEALYFGLVVTQAGQEANIEFFSPNREPFLEYDVSQLIYSVQQFDKPRLGLLSGLPLRSQMPMGMMPGQQPQPDQLIIQQWETTFELAEVDATAESLPENLDVLAVIHPQNVGEKMLFAIDQFLLSGKPVIVAVDPSSYHFKGQQRQNQMMMGQPPQGVTSDLPRLFNAWGINYTSSEVVGDPSLATSVQTGAGISSFPVWLSLTKENFSADILPTSSLNTMLMIEPGSVAAAGDRNYEITPLVQTTPRAGTVAGMMLSFTPPNEVARQLTDGGVAKNLAVLVRGTFKTAFPDGAPKDPEPADDSSDAAENNEDAENSAEDADTDAATDETETAEAADAAEEAEGKTPALAESAKPGTLVVAADSDWLLDQFSVRRMNFLGMQAVEPLNDNLAFASNLADFLGGSEDLISIRGKGSAQRPFEVIREMELAAQERYQAELQGLEDRRNEIQQEIQKLQTQQTEGRTLIASPEVSEALERYRVQEAELRTSIRKIRLSLREGIESLQNGLTVLNLLIVPLAVITAGLVLLIGRNRRQKSASAK
ncbi:MAG: Gldg family protein [Opitutaceae bacterium]